MTKKAIVTKRVHSKGKTKIVEKLPVFDKKVNKLAKRTVKAANKKNKKKS